MMGPIRSGFGDVQNANFWYLDGATLISQNPNEVVPLDQYRDAYSPNYAQYRAQMGRTPTSGSPAGQQVSQWVEDNKTALAIAGGSLLLLLVVKRGRS